jgi:TPR repeat protein
VQVSWWRRQNKSHRAKLLVNRVVVCLAVLLAFSSAVPAAAENRFALVIGNSDYTSAPLANPVNDAERMSEALAKVGFDVRTVRNANQDVMKTEILAFGRRLASGDSVGLFYYAGHGVQIDGQNYLIPLGADIQDGTDIPLLGVNLSVLLRSMGRARSRLNIAILDACRDNPFAGHARSLSRGLAPVEAPSGTLIAYATAPGQVALDGQGGNSPYTAALVEAIPTTGIPIEDVFRQTRRQVLAKTGGRQTPWEHSSLTAAFYFLPKALEPEVSNRNENGLRDPSRDRRLAELAAWEKIKDQGQPTVFRQHIKTYPDGLFVELASLKLEQLDKTSAPWTWIITGSSGRTGSRTAASFYEEALTLETSARPNEVTEFRKALALYQQAADLGLPVAMFRLARFYDKGLGTGQDFHLAATWYARAANEGHIGAAAALGTMHEFGQGADANLVEALRLYQAAAERGDAFAMASLGYLYAEGKGVARDRTRAVTWYTRAAKQGQSRAMFNLGLLLLAEKGSRSNERRAVAWLKKAAENGHTGAQRELAVLYDEGRTVKRDTKLAAKYLLAAFGAGDKRAAFDIRVRPDTWSFWTRRQIQKRLRKLGYYQGHAHGFFDSRTKIALEAFADNSERSQQASL